MKSLLLKFADYLVAQTDGIVCRWVEAVEAQPEIESAGSLPRQQLVDHLPALCRDLAERLRLASQSRDDSTREVKHAQAHGLRRWAQGFRLDEIIRESGIIRRVISAEYLPAFAHENPDFERPLQAEAEAVIHMFFTDMLVESAHEFVTEQEAHLAARDQSLQAILDSALDCIIVIGQDGCVREWNPAAEKLFGYPRAAAIGAELASLIIPDELQAQHRGGLAHYLATGHGPLLGKRVEVPAVCANGSRLLVELAITTSELEGQAVFTAYLRDITERVRNEKRRTAQYAIASLISSQAPLQEIGGTILSTITESGRWRFGTLWVLDDERKLICQSTWRLEDDQLTQFETATLRQVFAVGEGLPGRVVASGAPTWLADVNEDGDFPRAAAACASGLRGAFAFPLAGSTGINGVIELFSDERIAPDEDLLRLVESLGIQVGLYIERQRTEEELRRQKDAAEKANQAKDRFLAALSHELRTPLNPVLMWACSVSDRKDLDPELKEGLQMICRNIGMEARLIDDLLDLTRIARGKLQLHLQPCRADLLFEHALEIVRSQLAGKSLRVSVDLAAQNHQILADPTRIEQVFWNLLKNACKFTPEEGEIAVRSYNSGEDELIFEISDNGRGIDSELMPRLFTAFEQGTGSGEGLGLGLAICRAVLEMHQGKITASNRSPGPGAIFTVELATLATSAAGALPARKAPSAPLRNLHILVVEDHEHTAAVMGKLLQSDGHKITIAGTVGEAVQLLQKNRFDLLVSDLGLPDGNGFQIMREVARTSSAKGIAMSGYGMEEDLERSSQAGFSVHLTKPVSAEELREAIRQVTAAT